MGRAFVRASQARRIDDFQGRLRDFFRLIDLAKLGDAEFVRQYLAQRGFTRLYNLGGGLVSWTRCGLPLTV